MPSQTYRFPTAAQVQRDLESHEPRPLFPTIDDRTAWNDRRATLQDGGKAFLAAADEAARQPLPALTASHQQDYARTGNRQMFERVYFARHRAFAALVIGACLDPSPQRLDAAQDAIWSLCEQSAWALPAHHPKLPDPRRPHVDLGAAGQGFVLAEAASVLAPRLDAGTCERVHHELRYRLLDPVMQRDDWRWFHKDPTETHNNWAAVCAGGAIQSALHIEPDVALQARLIVRLLPSLQAFLNSFTDDGGCSEGISYWKYGFGRFMMALHHLEHRLGRRLDWFDEEMLRRIAAFPVHTQMGSAGWPTFADCPRRFRLSSAVAREAADRFDLPALRDAARPRQAAEGGVRLMDALRHLWWQTERPATPEPLPLCSFLPVLQWMVARHDVGGPRELVVAVKGGHNAEEHNHNDVGAMVVAVGDTHVVIDPGAPQYTAATFSKQRYASPLCNSVGHAVPVVAGHAQLTGRAAAAEVLDHSSDEAVSQLLLELAAAYPAEAGLASLIRQVALHHQAQPYVTINDRFRFRDGPAQCVSVLPTFGAVTLEPGGALIIEGAAALRVTWEGDLQAEVQTLADLALKDGVADLHLLRIMHRLPLREGAITLRLEPATVGP